MRRSDVVSGSLFSYVDLEDRVPAKHPLRLIRGIVNEVLLALDADFSAMYADQPQRVLRGNAILKIHVREHRPRHHIRSAHRRLPADGETESDLRYDVSVAFFNGLLNQGSCPNIDALRRWPL